MIKEGGVAVILLVFSVAVISGAAVLFEDEAGDHMELDAQVREKLEFIFAEDDEIRPVDTNGSTVYISQERAMLAKMRESEGYGGAVEIIVGFCSRGRITDVYVLEHSETPNLGDRIEKGEFRAQFREKGPEDPLQLGEDIDGLTGATRSAEAVVQGVRESLKVVSELLPEIEL